MEFAIVAGLILGLVLVALHQFFARRSEAQDAECLRDRLLECASDLTNATNRGDFWRKDYVGGCLPAREAEGTFPVGEPVSASWRSLLAPLILPLVTSPLHLSEALPLVGRQLM